MIRAALRACAAALLLPAAAAGTDGEAQAPPCLASVVLEPDRAFVGQQVLYRLRIATRRDVSSIAWNEPPAFPGFRSERLPGSPQVGRILHAGRHYGVREEQRALFPERAGTLAIPAASVACDTDAGGESTTPVPVATLRVREAPVDERPPDWSGLVGPVALRVRVEPRTVTLGESVRLEVSVLGGGNVWDAPDPLGAADTLGGAEIFRARPELAFERGTRLLAWRRFAYDLVPRSEGTLSIPEIRMSYLDPESGRYAQAVAPAHVLPVAPRAAAPVVRRPPRAVAPPSPPQRTPWTRALLAVGVALLAGAVGFAALRARRLSASIAPALEAAAAARAAGDAEREAAELARALRAALAHHVASAGVRSAEELRGDPALGPAAAEGAALLAALDKARFDPSAGAPPRAAVEQSVGRLRRAALWPRRAR